MLPKNYFMQLQIRSYFCYHICINSYRALKQHRDKKHLKGYDKDSNMCITESSRTANCDWKSVYYLNGLNNVLVSILIEIFDHKSVLHRYILRGRWSAGPHHTIFRPLTGERPNLIKRLSKHVYCHYNCIMYLSITITQNKQRG